MTATSRPQPQLRSLEDDIAEIEWLMAEQRADLDELARRREIRRRAIDSGLIQTRADLALLPGFKELGRDTGGNPCVWMNFYACDCGCEWSDDWSCQVDDECGACGGTCSPTRRTWLGPSDGYEIWESLPEKD